MYEKEIKTTGARPVFNLFGALVWIILLKLQFSLQDLDTGRSVNLIPFYYDKEIGTAFHLKRSALKIF